MNTIEKIRAEIEGLIEMNKTKNGFPAGTICAVRIEAYEHLLAFLDTLSEEPSKGLDVTDFCKPIDPGIAQCVADHWWELLGDKEPDKSLEEAAEMRAIEYAERETPKDADGEIWKVGDVMIENRMSFEDGFIVGAKWQKQQMLKDAVEGYVGMHLTDKGTKVTVNSGYLPEEMGIRSDSKVRIIIVKGED